MDSYFVETTLTDDGYYVVSYGPEEGSPHNQAVALFYEEEEAWIYCNFKNNLETLPFEDESDEGYTDLEE